MNKSWISLHEMISDRCFRFRAAPSCLTDFPLLNRQSGSRGKDDCRKRRWILHARLGALRFSVNPRVHFFDASSRPSKEKSKICDPLHSFLWPPKSLSTRRGSPKPTPLKKKNTHPGRRGVPFDRTNSDEWNAVNLNIHLSDDVDGFIVTIRIRIREIERQRAGFYIESIIRNHEVLRFRIR